MLSSFILYVGGGVNPTSRMKFLTNKKESTMRLGQRVIALESTREHEMFDLLTSLESSDI